jgi:hypothetical protein
MVLALTPVFASDPWVDQPELAQVAGTSRIPAVQDLREPVLGA